MITIKKETIFISLIGAYIISYNTILLEPYRYVSHITKLFVIFALFMFVKNNKLSGTAGLILFLYSILLIYGLLIATINNNFAASFQQTLKYSFRLLAFAAILMVLHTGRYSDNVVKFPIWIGIVFSLQSLLLFILIYTGHEPKLTFFEHSIRGRLLSYGILGFAPGIHSIGGYQVLRVSSFFSEASNFAKFLGYSILVSFGYYKISGRKRYLLLMIISFLAFVVTFSLTGYLSLLLAILVIPMLKKRTLLAKLIVPICIISFIFLLHLYLKKTYIPDPTQRNIVQHILLSKYGEGMRATAGIKGLYGGRVYSAIQGAKFFMEYPLGIGLMNNPDIDVMDKYGNKAFTDIHIYGAFWSWLIKTGFVGISIFILIFYFLFKKMKSIMSDRSDIRYYISIAFIAMAIHHIVTGDWIDPMFLFVMALILTFKAPLSLCGEGQGEG